MRHLIDRLGWAGLCVVAAIGCGGSNDGGMANTTAAPSGATSATTPTSPAMTTTSAGSAGTKASTPPMASTSPAKASGAAPASTSSSGAAGAPSSTGTVAPTTPPATMGSASAAGASGAPAAMSGSAGAGATAPKAPSGTSTLFYLDNTGGRVLRANADGTKASTIVPMGGSGPDGVAVDVAGGHVFWTNMGLPDANDGTVMRADLDGKNVMTIVKSGGTYTPKQLKLESRSGKLYWSDREGMKVQRANLDGSMLETLVVTGTAGTDDSSHWCVGMALDVAGGKIYWTQKGGESAGPNHGSIRRANIEPPAGADPAKRTDVEVLFDKLPEPIDLDIDVEHRLLYWTDRTDNTVSRAPLDLPAGADPAARKDREILVMGSGTLIGISLDLGRGKMYYTSLSGVVAEADLDGKNGKNLLMGQGFNTGIAQVDLPSM